MKPFLADLHIHSTLSPCGGLEMNAFDIVAQAKRKGMNIIALTDHNTTKQVAVVKELALKSNILVIPGVEVNTLEEIHCLVYFETMGQLDEFQLYIDQHLPRIKNQPEVYGDQVWADAHGIILGEEENLLIVALDCTLEELSEKVISLNGLLVPAHIDRQQHGILFQLGGIPEYLNFDAVEVLKVENYSEVLMVFPEVGRFNVMANSDAHYLKDIGTRYTIFNILSPSFNELRMAMHKLDGRSMGC